MRIRNFSNFDKVNENEQGGGNKFILVRFGNTPDPRVTQYFGEIAVLNPKPVAMRGPGSIITMFETSLTKEALIQGFDRLGITYNLYQIVHTSKGGTGNAIVAREKSVADLKKELGRAVTAENWEEAARLRDEIAAKEGHPVNRRTEESLVQSFNSFLYEKEEEEFVNGETTEEFNRLVSQLVDHELAELETEDEEGITKAECQKIKDYLVQNNIYVAPVKAEEAGEKKEGE